MKNIKKSVQKPVDAAIAFANTMIAELKKIPKLKDDTIHPDIATMEKDVDDVVYNLSPEEQARVMFFLIVILSKLSMGKPTVKEGVYSNPVMIARTFVSVLNTVSSPLSMDIIDVAFQLIQHPLADISKKDLDGIRTMLKTPSLEDVEPAGNA